MTTALVFPNAPTAPASWDVGLARGTDPGEANRFAGFLERALIESEPPSNPRIGSSDDRSNDREGDGSRVEVDESNGRTAHDDRKARETERAREADGKAGKDDGRGVRKNQNTDRSDETESGDEDRASAAKRETEAAAESDAREKTSGRRTTNAKAVAAELGEEAGKTSKAIKKDSRDGAAVTGADAKKSISDDDESSRAGAAGAQKRLDRQEARGSQLETKRGDGGADSRHAANGLDAGKKAQPDDDESERIDAANAK